MKKTLYTVSLGCPKNLVDTEVMLGLLNNAGYLPVQSPEEAGLLLINTCGFIGSAVEEAVDEILALAEFKTTAPDRKLVVAGCLVQRYGEALRKELPEVDLFVGPGNFHHIVQFLEQHHQPSLTGDAAAPEFLMNSSLPRQLSTPSHRAYLKITEGCSNRCSYCLIPALRGRLRSRPENDLLIEARALAAGGVKELTLVGQDLLSYGTDLQQSQGLRNLLTGLLEQTDIPWLRLLYLHPARLTEGFLDFMAANPRILPYLDIPVQHVNERILKLMNRPWDRRRLEHLLISCRRRFEQVALRTTIMIGFPGETAEAFSELLDFVREYRFDHLGVFPYANEEGCRAATLPGQIPEAEKEARRAELMTIQRRISREKQQEFVGKVEKVLVEGVSRETDLLLEGRTRFQAPEIDGRVYITSGTAAPGDIVEVTITDAHDYDLAGELV